MPFSRRTFVRGAAAIPFAVWLEQQAWAQTVSIRYDATSANGQAMLKIYAGAVKKMMDAAQIKEGNPHSWVFQWYTHFVRRDRTKAGELARIYPNLTPPNDVWKALATEVWNTCQSHMGQNENYFLPWHRMVVFYFEEIIRNVSGVPSFTLPYWNYTVKGPLHGVIPPEFRKKGDATFGSLYIDKRNPGVNNGDSISKGFNPDPINLDSFKQCNYQGNGSGVLGFCRDIDANLHGQVHVRTGNQVNMGDVPWAAGDPIFWLHHCQIDRLWASWNAAGHTNPSDNPFLIKTFTFADGKGNKVIAKIGDVLNIANMKYRYDSLETVPKCSIGVPTANAAAPRRLVEKKSPIPLGPGPVRQKLEAPPSPTASVPLGDRIAKLAPNKKLFLVVRNLQASAQPGVTFNLFLELPAATGDAAHFVGSIHFFDAAMNMPSDKYFSFDITDVAKRLKAQGKLATNAELTIAPAGTPAANAKPVIGDVSIVEE
ncbi:MAG: tyrosinase family protein [Acidobacteria bacterium]|nr:tyrosinase family protein [Acidobacteriota bacterium]MBV9186271.1 tyrosinase family protein [Acidobacteriota bacterium]